MTRKILRERSGRERLICTPEPGCMGIPRHPGGPVLPKHLAALDSWGMSPLGQCDRVPLG